jgi:uncharacterized protein
LSLQLTIEPGARTYTPVPVATLASGLELTLPVHVVAGRAPGPTLGLTAGTHGDAIAGPKWVKAVLDELDPAELTGTVIAVPVGNPPAFEWGNRHTPIDGVNMNRVYPGDPNGRVTDQMAHLVHELVSGLDVHVDCHGGGEDAINYMYARPSGGKDLEYDARTLELARVFGMEYLWEGAFYAGSLTNMAFRRGIPGLLLELGMIEPVGDRFLREAVTGTFNLMKHLGMLPGVPEPIRPSQWLLRERKLLRPQNGGLFVPELGPDCLNAVLPRGTVLGRVLDPGRLEEIEVITAPYDETVVLQMRHALSRVQPGSYAFILANRASADRLDAR